MLIRFWGARGSIGVSGEEYLKYGGDTTCVEIRTNSGEVIIIDAGTGIRRLGRSMLSEGIWEYSLLFTHAHWDHLMGFPFFAPIYMTDTKINMFGCPLSQGNVETFLAETMKAPFFPVPFELVRSKINFTEVTDHCMALGDMTINCIPLSHPNGGVGMKFTEDGKSFVFLTDNELTYQHEGGRSFEEYVEFCKDADVLVHDAEYLPDEYDVRKTWGHTVYTDALELALQAGAKQFGLFHHNQDRTDDAVDAMVEHCSNISHERGGPNCFGVAQDMVIEL